MGLKQSERKQCTLKRSVSYSGIGIHTGQMVQMRFVPAPVETGILFQRTDLIGQPIVPATLSYVCDTSRSTTISRAEVRVQTIEHVMAALSALKVDNLVIELSNIEPPVGNGSSDVFVDMIEEAGIVEQEEFVDVFAVKEPLFFVENDVAIVALPYEGFKVSYTLSYPGIAPLKCQFFSSEITEEVFKKEIAPCRTFTLYTEISALMDTGLIKGGSLDNAVVIKEGAALSKNGLFFPDEMVRHKVLDMIGDVAGLIGLDLCTHLVAIRAGHPSNHAFATKLWSHIHG